MQNYQIIASSIKFEPCLTRATHDSKNIILGGSLLKISSASKELLSPSQVTDNEISLEPISDLVGLPASSVGHLVSH